MSDETDEIESEEVGTPERLPLYRKLLVKMRGEGLEYGKSWSLGFFEKAFRAGSHEASFAFEMLGLRKMMEEEDGYYLRQQGRFYQITPADEIEDVSQSFERRMRRFAVRSVTLRSDTLSNGKAVLTDLARAKMEKNVAQAAIRLALLSRKSFDEPKNEPPKQLL